MYAFDHLKYLISLLLLDETLSFVGRGTYGDVFLMRNQFNLTTYAVKRIPRLSSSTTKEEEASVNSDILKAASIEDPHIISLIDFYRDSVQNYYVYQHQENGNLRQFLNAKTFPSDVTSFNVWIFSLLFLFWKTYPDQIL